MVFVSLTSKGTIMEILSSSKWLHPYPPLLSNWILEFPLSTPREVEFGIDSDPIICFSYPISKKYDVVILGFFAYIIM